jgi:phytoene dehydrogenase-like protein
MCETTAKAPGGAAVPRTRPGSRPPPQAAARGGARWRSRSRARYDVVIVGAGHNGLVAATLLGRAGRSVLILERREQVGGAAISGSPFPGVDARLSGYSYLVSLFPASLLRSLGVSVRLRVRTVSSYTPAGDAGLLVSDDREATRSSMTNVTGDPGAFDAW